MAKEKEPSCRKKKSEMQLVMHTEQKKGRGLEEQYMMGSQVQIIGGVYQRGSPVGVIVGATRCYVDVKVPQMKCQARVHKTSVVPDNNGQKGQKF